MAAFRVARASEYLAITGWGVDDVKLAKKAWVWPGQRCEVLDVAPASYEVEAQGATSESFPVVLRAAYTVGPNIAAGGKPDKAPLLLYAKLVAPPSRGSKNKKDICSSRVRKLVLAAMEAHVGVLAAGMSAEQVLGGKGGAGFAEEVLERVRLDLGDEFGLRVYNASVKSLVVRVPAGKYLSDVRKTRQLEAAVKKLKADAQLRVAAAAANNGDTQAQERNAALYRVMPAAVEAVAHRIFEREWPRIMSAAMDSACRAFAVLVGGGDTSAAQQEGGVLPVAAQEQTAVAAAAEGQQRDAN